MESVDSEFFIRLRQSRLLAQDRSNECSDYRWPLFNDDDFTERDYYERFPTIYHLRAWLMETDEKADLRLIYLAMHNIVKHRGNFLREGQSTLSAKNASPKDALRAFDDTLSAWCDVRGYSYTALSYSKVLSVLADDRMGPSARRDAIADFIGVEIEDDATLAKKIRRALAGAIVGLKTDFKVLFGDIGAEKPGFKLSEDEAVESFRAVCPDDGMELFESLCSVYSAYVLQGLLSYAPGKTISYSMIEKYNQYGRDLALLKDLVRTYAPRKYNDFFRGSQYPSEQRPDNKTMYDSSKVQGYTKYNLGPSKLSYDDFKRSVEKLFSGTRATSDSRYERMMAAFERQQFLRRLKTSDNGAIYFQLHLEELKEIIKKQGKHYPFLKQDAEKFALLVSFRIPYYVGPLTEKNARLDAHGNPRFAWSERRLGKENTPITPWNWEEVIDCGKSAEKFITRMTGQCTYLQGEPVLPKCSLLYEEFCVLNELNGARWSEDGDHEVRFDAADREGILNDLFCKRKVFYKQVEDWLSREQGCMSPHVKGGQGETGFESKLGSYIFFCKDVFHVDVLDKADYPMIEELILWNTLFEDRKILKEKIEKAYGNRLTQEQIKTVCKKRFSGWGNLSRRFLTGLKVSVSTGERVSIMDVLRNGNPNAGKQGRTMVLMEALRDEDLGFQKKVDDFNRAYFAEADDGVGINELSGSPAIRRSLNQAIRIVDEISKIAGRPPESIFVEVTRDEDPRKKGKRTTRRYSELKFALEQFKKDDPDVWRELCEMSSSDLDERLTLYFMQRGKCLYSGRSIDINRLGDSGLYEVDHIIPRAYVKDDSFENKALVYREENQRKTDELLLDRSIRRRMASHWRMLHDAKLIGDKKFNNLLRDHVDEKAMGGFIARQLVETSQMVKLIQSLLGARYPGTNIVPVKASMTHDLRERALLYKSREANDYHHAHDAYLACRMGLFIQVRHPGIYSDPIGYAHVIRKYVHGQSEEFRRTHKMLGSSGFVVNSFMSSGFDKQTGEIFNDVWDAEAAVESIRRTLSYRDCFITRMPFEDTGVFWDATIYSPRGGKNLGLPLKEGLDPWKYGSFSREQFAYFFVYEALNVKKGKREFRFEPVPVKLAVRMKGDTHALEAYACQLAGAEGLRFVRIVRSKILKKQLVEINGDRLFITGKVEARNARQLAFTQDEMALFAVMKSSDNEDERLLAAQELLESIARRGESIGGRMYKALQRVLCSDEFPELSGDDTSRLVLGLCAVCNAVSNVVDLTGVGGGKNSGKIQLTYRNLLSDPCVNFYIVDQSVTGMFERRERIGL